MSSLDLMKLLYSQYVSHCCKAKLIMAQRNAGEYVYICKKCLQECDSVAKNDETIFKDL